MTTDSRNYSGPGAAGAVPLPGRNAAGVPQTPGPAVAGADNPPNCTLPGYHVAAFIASLGSNTSATAGPTCLSYGSSAAYGANGSITVTDLALNGYNSMSSRDVIVNYGTITVNGVTTC